MQKKRCAGKVPTRNAVNRNMTPKRLDGAHALGDGAKLLKWRVSNQP